MHASSVAGTGAVLRRLWSTIQAWLDRRHKERRLQLRETLSLGERRFLAVVEFQQQEFLVGGTGSSIALLARLSGGTTSSENSDAGPSALLPREGIL